MYIVLDVAGAPSQGTDPSLPVQMEVDWVRLYQNPQRHTRGCDPASHPTATYIAKTGERLGVGSL